jgi:hypothetical protein
LELITGLLKCLKIRALEKIDKWQRGKAGTDRYSDEAFGTISKISICSQRTNRNFIFIFLFKKGACKFKDPLYMYKKNCFNLLALKKYSSFNFSCKNFVYNSASGHDSSVQVVRNFQLVERITLITSHIFDSSHAT